MEKQKLSTRFLSVQSHVVSGYCGNKSAVFPLQLLELEVDVINTVQLSNHTQYKVFPGQIFHSDDLEEIHIGLRENELLCLYDNVLSGYVADTGYLESLSKLVREIKDERKKLGKECLYTLDPVLGDTGLGYYVPYGDKIAATYENTLLQLADIITPNQFETSILTRVELDVAPNILLPQLAKALDVFHKRGIRVVVITSIELPTRKNELFSILSFNASHYKGDDSTKFFGSGREEEAWVVSVPKINYTFTGTGDMFSALITGWLRKSEFNFKLSLEATVNTIQAILEDTQNWLQKCCGEPSVHDCELRLVQNRDEIINPKSTFRARKLDLRKLDSLFNVVGD